MWRWKLGVVSLTVWRVESAVRVVFGASERARRGWLQACSTDESASIVIPRGSHGARCMMRLSLVGPLEVRVPGLIQTEARGVNIKPEIDPHPAPGLD